MRTTKVLALAAVAAATGLQVAMATPAEARPAPERHAACVDEHGDSARGGHGADHRDVSAKEQRAIARETRARLEARGVT